MRKAMKWLLLMVMWVFLPALPAQGGAVRPITMGLSPALLHDQYTTLAAWRAYLEARLQRSVEFVPRDRYRETMDLLQQKKIDFAWICGYPYLALQDEVRLLAVALNQGQPSFRSYLIVPAGDSTTRSIADLQGAVFAFADPYSNTGYLVPRRELMRLDRTPGQFFRRTFFTWSHRHAIDSVAAGLAQGAAVDSYVWDTLAKVHPEITAKTRIAWQSEPYGFPPVVAHNAVPEADFVAMQRVLLGMKDDPQGRELLARLNLDGFITGSPALYDGVAKIMNAVGER